LDDVGTFGTRAQNGFTALLSTVLKDHADCVRLLVDAGADMNATTNVRDSRSVGSGRIGRACFEDGMIMSYWFFMAAFDLRFYFRFLFQI
jgi:hypothetical protein